mgnify:FL=1
MTLTMAACGTDPASVDYFGMGYDDLKNGMEQDVASLVNMTDENRESINAYGSDEVIKLLTTWDDTVADLGAYQGLGEFSVDKAQDTVTTTQVVKFPGRDVTVTYVYSYDYETEQPALTDANVDLVYTLGEQMSKAGMNTLMGMGTVFVVLILISLIISCFKIFPYLEKKKAGKNAAEPTVVEQVAQREEQQLTDDLELVAVITAAIAASENASADGLVVRSIIRR